MSPRERKSQEAEVLTAVVKIPGPRQGKWTPANNRHSAESAGKRMNPAWKARGASWLDSLVQPHLSGGTPLPACSRSLAEPPSAGAPQPRTPGAGAEPKARRGHLCHRSASCESLSGHMPCIKEGNSYFFNSPLYILGPFRALHRPTHPYNRPV